MVAEKTDPQNPDPSPPPLFTKGSLVEVSSDDDGFKGAWFVATILDDPPPKPKPSSKRKQPHQKPSFLVEYQTLLADESESEPLTEYVDATFLRPLPPPVESEGFELNDVVDAFYRDGWWTGVVTSVVVDKLRFKVFFQNPPEEAEFESKDLRVHQDWVHGKWVRSGKQRTTGIIFSKGSAVEVNIAKENSRDVWFPAIFCEEIGDSSFLVDYQSLGDDNEAATIKATVDSLHIRPCPPDLGDNNFELLEKVDAFYNFGWWSGIITKVLAGGRYTIFCKHINKDMELSHSELRPHMEYVDGKWFRGSKEVVVMSKHQEQSEQTHTNDTEMAAHLESPGTATNSVEEKTSQSKNSRKYQIEKSSPCNEESPSNVGTLNKDRKKHRDHNSDATLLRPSKKLKDANKMEVPLSATACQSRTIAIETSTKAHAGSASPTGGDTETNCLKKPMVEDQPSAKTQSFVWSKTVETKNQRVSPPFNLKTDVGRRKERRPRESLVNTPIMSALGKVEVPIVLGLESRQMRTSQAKDSCRLSKGEPPKQMSDQKEPAGCKSMEITQYLEVGVKTQTKRRGRPRKLVTESPKVLVAGEEHNGEGNHADKLFIQDVTHNEVESPTIMGLESRVATTRLIRSRKRPVNTPGKQENIRGNVIRLSITRKEELPDEKVAQKFGKKPGKHSLRRGRKRHISLNGDLLTKDASKEKTAELTGTVCVMKEAEMAITGIPNNTADEDKPLSTWFEGMHSPTIVDDTSRAVNQLDKAQEIQNGCSTLSTAIVATGGNMLVTSQSLPFVKSSPIWKTLESMEIFQVMPQNPHFHPLARSKEERREGLAVGNMVTFASLVERVSKLQIDDPRGIIDSSLEALLDLEMHGFDVGAVRGRLNGLLVIKDKQEKLEEQTKEVEMQMQNCTQEKTKIDEEIDKIDKKIRDLQEKRVAVMSKKESKDSEIAMLRSSVDVISEDIRGVQLDFERLVAASW